MGLFEPQAAESSLKKEPGKSPLADRMRPETLEEYKGERGRRGKKLPRGFRTVDRIDREVAVSEAVSSKPPEQATFDNF